MVCPHGSWMSSTGGPCGVGAQVSPQVVSAVMIGASARPLSVRAYSLGGIATRLNLAVEPAERPPSAGARS